MCFTDCFNKIVPNDGKWCESQIEYSNYHNICDGTRDDCVSKGKQQCSSDPDCYGITFPYRDGDPRQANWFLMKKGVRLCKSGSLIEKPEKDWTMHMKCEGTISLVYITLDSQTI